MKSLTIKLILMIAFVSSTAANSQTVNRDLIWEAINEIGDTWRYVEHNSDNQNISFVGMRARDYLQHLGYYNTASVVSSFSTVGQMFEGDGLRLNDGVYLQADTNVRDEIFLRIVVRF